MMRLLELPLYLVTEHSVKSRGRLPVSLSPSDVVPVRAHHCSAPDPCAAVVTVPLLT